MKNQILLIFNSKKLFGIKTKCKLIEKMIIKITAHAIIVLRCIKNVSKKKKYRKPRKPNKINRINN